MLSKNSKLIAMKQAFAFCIDMIIVSLPLIVAPSLESFPIFVLLWFIYIPFSEFYFSQTLGMKIVGTKILNSNDMQSGLVEAHQNKQYKVLFFVFVIAFIVDELRRFW